MTKTAFIDVDGTAEDMLPEWLRWYNLEYDDFLKPENITHWDLHKFVKPQCGMKIYNYLDDPRLYDKVKPMKGAVEGVNLLRAKGWRVVFATTTPRTTPYRKFDLLKEHGFEPKLKEYIEIADKSLLNGMGSFLLDDSFSNVLNFKGMGVLFTQYHNTKEHPELRVNDWSELCKQVWL
jgi:5'(3')-deoxyribonucleotidase